MLSIDATFIFVFVSFLIFLFLMKIVCWAPIMKIIKEREALIFENQKKADESVLKKEKIQNEIENSILVSKQEGSKILKEASEENKRIKEKIIEEKKKEAKESKEALEAELEVQSKNAEAEFQNEINGHVKKIVSKILKVDENSVNPDFSQTQK